MSITFSIQGLEEEDGLDLPCEMCGCRLDRSCGHFDCQCGGYGGPKNFPRPRYELNVANTNGLALLRFLNMDAEYYGSIDPDPMLAALAARRLSADELVEEPTVERLTRLSPQGIDQGPLIHHCGRTRDQVDRYLEVLTRIAKMAKRIGREIVWG